MGEVSVDVDFFFFSYSYFLLFVLSSRYILNIASWFQISYSWKQLYVYFYIYEIFLGWNEKFFEYLVTYFKFWD